jgi:DNA-binding transcriptional MerR regulator
MAGDFERLFGRLPFGWRRAEDGRRVKDAAEQNVLAKIMACRAAGMSLRQIAAILKESRNGR